MKQEIALCFLGEESSSPVVLLEDRQRYSLVSLARFDRQNSCTKYIQAAFASLQTKHFWASSLEKDITDFWCVLGRHSFSNKYINQLFCSISISAAVQHGKLWGENVLFPTLSSVCGRMSSMCTSVHHPCALPLTAPVQTEEFVTNLTVLGCFP